MREVFDVPEDDRFMMIDEHDKSNFLYGENYLGIARDDDLVIVQITVNNTRGPEQKKALFARLAELLAKNPGIKPENKSPRRIGRLATASRNMREREATIVFLRSLGYPAACRRKPSGLVRAAFKKSARPS